MMWFPVIVTVEDTRHDIEARSLHETIWIQAGNAYLAARMCLDWLKLKPGQDLLSIAVGVGMKGRPRNAKRSMRVVTVE